MHQVSNILVCSVLGSLAIDRHAERWTTA